MQLHSPKPEVFVSEEEWKTSDLYLAAFIKAAGTVFQRHVRGSDGRVFFIFIRSQNIDVLVRDYFAGSARIQAFQFVTDIRALKSLVHS